MGAGASPLLGRSDEIARVERALERAEEGAARVVPIVGEPGIGKTTLLRELCARADERRHLVLEGRAAEFEGDAPFGVFVDALDDYAASLGERQLERLSGGRLDELAGVLPSVPAPAGDRPASVPVERYRAYRALRNMLEQLALRRPLVLALDDMHWADPASIELACHLLRSRLRAPVLLAAAFRPNQFSPELAAALAAVAR